MEVIVPEAESDEDKTLRHQAGFDESCEDVAVGIEAEVVAAGENDGGCIRYLSVHLQHPAASGGVFVARNDGTLISGVVAGDF